MVATLFPLNEGRALGMPSMALAHLGPSRRSFRTPQCLDYDITVIAWSGLTS